MELVRKFLLLLIVINTLDKIQFSSSSIPPSLADQVAITLKSCFDDRLNPVIISEDLTDIVYKDTIDFPVLVISENFEAKSIKPYFNPRYPTYVLSVNSVKKFEATLQELATLPTWSIDSIFIVIRYDDVDCDDDGRTILELLRNMDQLTAFYICYKSDKSLDGTEAMIYTVNPFSNRVPLPWQEVPHTRPIVKAQDQNGDNRSALFKRPYRNDPKICLSLKFEKTKHLDSYPVKMVVNVPLKTKSTQNKTVKFESLRNSLINSQYNYFEILFSVLNITVENEFVKVLNFTNSGVQSSLNGLANGTYDFGLNFKFITDPGYELIDIIIPHIYNNLFILTHPNGAQKPITSNQLITNFTNFTFAAISIIVLVVSYGIILINKVNNLNSGDIDDNDDYGDPEYGNSFLDILRMIISTGILTPLNSTSMRIMFITTTLLIFIVSPELQGEITSSSTKQEYNYPTGIKDLFDLKYNVYIYNGWKKILMEQKDKFNVDLNYLNFIMRPNDCHALILTDPTTACISYYREQIEMADKHDLHLLLIRELENYVFVGSRKNWPLKKKIDGVSLQLRETGFMRYWSNKHINLPLKKLRAKEASQPLSEYIPTEFDDLKLLYTWLASFALGLSVFVFIVEVLTARMKIRRRQKRIQERRRRLDIRLRKFREDNVNNRFLQDKVRIIKGRVVILP